MAFNKAKKKTEKKTKGENSSSARERAYGKQKGCYDEDV